MARDHIYISTTKNEISADFSTVNILCSLLFLPCRLPCAIHTHFRNFQLSLHGIAINLHFED